MYIHERFRGPYIKKYDAYQIRGKTRELSFSCNDEIRDPFQQLVLYNRCVCGYIYKKKYMDIRDIVCVRCYFQIPKEVRKRHRKILLGGKEHRNGSKNFSDPNWMEAVMDIMNELITVIPLSDRRKANIQNNYMLLLEAQVLWERKWERKRKEKVMREYLEGSCTQVEIDRIIAEEKQNWPSTL
jgi:hypothetical protein